MKDKDSYYVSNISYPFGSTIVIPAEICGKKVTEIGPYIYDPGDVDYDDFFTKGDLILPDGLLKIQYDAFQGSNFLSLHIPDSVTEIGNGAFSISSVRSIHLPASMPVIPAGLFPGCKRLETIEIPEGVTELAPGALKQCTGLKKLYLPATMTTIGENMFAKNVNVTIIGVQGSYAETYAQEHNLTFSTGEEPEPQPGQENVIKDGICYTYQKSSDSYLVTNFTGDITQEVTIPDTISGKTVTGIGDKAFYYCYRIRHVTLPSTIKSIGVSAFEKCVNLREINLPDGLKSIGHLAFNDTNLEQAIIPDSVTSLGNGIFAGVNLEKIRLPKSIKRINSTMFYEGGLPSPFTVPSGVKSIGDNAFGECGCSQVILPSTLTSIEDSAFNNSGIETIAIPDSVTKMGKEVFADSSILRTVKWGKGLKTVPESTFSSCHRLEEMSLPNTVTAIGPYAFDGSGIRRIIRDKGFLC